MATAFLLRVDGGHQWIDGRLHHPVADPHHEDGGEQDREVRRRAEYDPGAAYAMPHDREIHDSLHADEVAEGATEQDGQREPQRPRVADTSGLRLGELVHTFQIA